jgi:hypothetical protein
MHGAKRVGTATLVLAVAACSTTNPTPSSRYDGHYAGTRQSDRTEVCGITRLHGTTSARINRGHVDMDLFSPKTQLTGTVGEDGTVRASGMWTNPTGGFPGMTILNGKISDNELTGTASDFRCHTDVRLHRIPPPRGRSAGGGRGRPQRPD